MKKRKEEDEEYEVLEGRVKVLVGEVQGLEEWEWLEGGVVVGEGGEKRVVIRGKLK